MKCMTLAVGALGANCYIVETAPNRCVLIDVGGDAERVLALLEREHLTVEKILLTHGHHDHMGGVAQVQEKTGAEVYIHAADAEMLTSAEKSLGAYFSRNGFAPVTKYHTLQDGDTLTSGEVTFSVLHTPGHTKGSVCYQCRNVLFTGDTLFHNACGRVDFPGGSGAEMRESLRRLKQLEGEYSVFPGHNDATTLETERRNNPFMQGI